MIKNIKEQKNPLFGAITPGTFFRLAAYPSAIYQKVLGEKFNALWLGESETNHGHSFEYHLGSQQIDLTTEVMIINVVKIEILVNQ